MKYVKKFIAKFEFVQRIISIFKQSYQVLTSIQTIIILIIIFVFMFAFIAVDAFYLDKNELKKIMLLLSPQD
jgi:Na+/melibiose symporter-like transporter